MKELADQLNAKDADINVLKGQLNEAQVIFQLFTRI